jgi:hypothetical protein
MKPVMKQYCRRNWALAALLLSTATAIPADVVSDWNATMQAAVNNQPPFPQARFAAITQLAVFDAVNAITRDYQPYLRAITAPPSASPEAAAATAAHDVLKYYFPANAATLDAALASSLAAIPDSSAKSAGIVVGQAAAAAMIAARANDGSSPAAFYLPVATDPGVWQPTPSCTAAGGAFYQFRNMAPFGIRSSDQFRLGPPPALPSVRYSSAFDEVKTFGSTNSAQRPSDRADVARFYAAVAPVAVWNGAARQLSTAQGKTLAENARIFALINMALSDAAVATFDTKYRYVSWRPETAVHNAAFDGNDRTDPDPTWAPYIVTPCFPGYPSAHATLSNAAREVIEQIYEDEHISITLTSSAVPGVTLTYTSLSQITEDIDDARVYGGIHFRTDQAAGSALGRRVGRYVFRHNLISAHGRSVTPSGR